MALEEAYFAFQAVKGIQANKEYFISMVPLATIPKLFVFTDEELPPEVRAQRTLNKSRIPEMCNKYWFFCFYGVQGIVGKCSSKKFEYNQ